MISADPRDAGTHPYQPAPSNPFVEFSKSEIEQTLHSRFERVVETHSARLAVMTRTERLTYRELNARANRVAHAIVARCGVSAEPVALLFQQGVPSVIAILGALKAGKFYVSLDPHLPVKGVARLLADSRARLAVTDSRNLRLAQELCGDAIDILDVDRIGLDFAEDNLGLTGSPDALAYVYYTSGSTGMPKGVMDTHRNVLHNIMRYTNRLHICADDRLTLLQSFGFSGAVSSLFCALLNGACTLPIEFREETPRGVAQWLEASAITIYHSVPALFRALLTEGRSFPSVRLIRLEGDQASLADVELYRKHCTPDCLLVNGLGTTETGIACQYFIDRTTTIEGGKPPVGYPTDDMEIRLLDEDGKPFADAGRVGEIAVVSRYLSPGYWQNPVLTQRAFTRDPLGGLGRVYRTGDLGRLRPDGCVEYLGRNDARLKIRGQWVALADVESALLKVEEVRQAVVTAWEDQTGDSRLVAYVVAEDGAAPTASALRRRLATDLPAHMVPASYVMLEALPLSHNGKIDRKALPPPPEGRPTLEQEYIAPESLLQQRIAQVWEEMLGVRPVGVRDNFFDLGGDSLQATRMVDCLEEVLNREIPLSILFEAADVETLADILFQQNADLRLPFLPIQPGGPKPPFFLLHGDYLSGGFYCLELARHLGADQPFYALPPYGLDNQPVPTSYELMAAQHVETLRTFRPAGPYRLGGTCNGGLVAFEMARQLVACGQQVDVLVLIGSAAENLRFRVMQQTIAVAGALLRFPPRFRMELYELARRIVLSLDRRPLRSSVIQLLAKAWRMPGELAHLFRSTESGGSGTIRSSRIDFEAETPRERRDRLRETYLRIDRHYIPREYANPITLFWPADDPEPAEEAARRWRKVVPKVDLHVLPGTHVGSLTQDVKELAEHLMRCFERCDVAEPAGGNATPAIRLK